MIFVYPYKRKDSDFCIIHSVKLLNKYYPNSAIFTIGDKVDGIDNIPHDDSNIIRGANVTSKLLLASESFREFVYMNDDFFINDRIDFNRVYCGSELLERKEGKASISWNQSVDNTKHYLSDRNLSTITYECHQPVLFNSELLRSTMSQIDWMNNDHFVKSLYFNINPPTNPMPIDNVKLIEPNINRAELFLSMFGCFSIGQGFLTEQGANFIKKLI